MSPVTGYASGLSDHPTPIAALAFPYAWLEAPLAARLTYVADVPHWHDLHLWPSGRLFGERGEYRWQRHPNGTVHTVLLLESEPLPAPFSAPIHLDAVRDAALLLWGEWVDPQRDQQGNPDGGPRFYANEIPQIQIYPVDLQGRPRDNHTPRLVVCYYRDQQGVRGEFVRCVQCVMYATAEEP